MDDNLAIFLVISSAIFAATLLILATTWIKSRHRLLAQPAGDAAAEKIGLLNRENQQLKGEVSRLEERLVVLERIATDPAERTAREIESLR
jgi:FtsZ-binding cell division protein ZapB